jgi:hypothetical protein
MAAVSATNLVFANDFVLLVGQAVADEPALVPDTLVLVLVLVATLLAALLTVLLVELHAVVNASMAMATAIAIFRNIRFPRISLLSVLSKIDRTQ